MAKCLIESCKRRTGTEKGVSRGGARGYCPVHYQRWKRGLRGPELEAPINMPNKGITLTPVDTMIVHAALLETKNDLILDCLGGIAIENEITERTISNLRLKFSEFIMREP